MTLTRNLRIVCIQFEPCFKDVAASIVRAESLMNNLLPNDLDLLILPEMAFSGYCFDSLDDIRDFLEDSNTGPTFQWASRTAERLNCYVIVGFPQLELEISSSNSQGIASTTAIYSNSLLIVQPNGQLHSIYQKQILYETDKTWCSETKGGFKYIDLPFPTSSSFYLPPSSTALAEIDLRTFEMRREVGVFRICPSICMDLNPRGEDDFEDYELSRFALESKVDVLICCMNWLDSDQDGDRIDTPSKGERERKKGRVNTDEFDPDTDDSESSEEELTEQERSWNEVKDTLNYFAIRCSPLIGHKSLFVSCNRIGTEKGTRFTGSTSIMQFRAGPEVLIHASKKNSEVIRYTLRLN